jgi:hypothetical protein
MAPPLTVAPSPEETLAAQYEQENVHEVYNVRPPHPPAPSALLPASSMLALSLAGTVARRLTIR